MDAADKLLCQITMRLEVHDELVEKEKFSLRKLFARRSNAPKKKIPFRNSQGVAHSFDFDYSAIPAILAAAEKFREDSKEYYADRDRKRGRWIRHGSQLHFDVRIGFAADIGKQHFAQRSFDVENLTAERLEAELAPYNTKETAERLRAQDEQKAVAVQAIADSMILNADTVVRGPLRLKLAT